MINRVFRVIFVLIFLGVILYGYYFLNFYYGINIPCMFYKITGFYCPGCGITRCLFSIIRGDIYDAFCYNRLVFILLPFIVFYVIYKIYLYIFDKKDNIIKNIPNGVFIVILVLLVIFGIIRNMDCFSYLQP